MSREERRVRRRVKEWESVGGGVTCEEEGERLVLVLVFGEKMNAEGSTLEKA